MADFMQKLFSKVTGWDSQDPYEDQEYAPEETYDPASEISVPNETSRERGGLFRRQGRVVDMRAPSGQQIVFLHPGSIETAQEACNHLRAGRTVVCNFERIDQKTAQRVIDFITGATFALDGQVTKVSPVIFLVAPHSTMIIDENAAETTDSVRIQGVPGGY